MSDVGERRPVNTDYAVSLLEQLKFFYEQKLLTDVVLLVEDTEFPCHKMVLATCSSYFRWVWARPSRSPSLKSATSLKFVVCGVRLFVARSLQPAEVSVFTCDSRLSLMSPIDFFSFCFFLIGPDLSVFLSAFSVLARRRSASVER